MESRDYTYADLDEIDYSLEIRAQRHEWVLHLASALVGEVFAAGYPITLFRVAGQPQPFLTDGFHRLAAFRLGEHPLGSPYPPGSPRPHAIRAVIRDGTYEEAVEHSAVANAQHGRRLDKYDLPASILRLHGLHRPHREIVALLGLRASQRSTVNDAIQRARGRVLPARLDDHLARASSVLGTVISELGRLRRVPPDMLAAQLLAEDADRWGRDEPRPSAAAYGVDLRKGASHLHDLAGHLEATAAEMDAR